MGRDGDKKTKKSLAEQLASLNLELHEKNEQGGTKKERERPGRPPKKVAKSAERKEALAKEPVKALSDQELFEQALQSMDAAQIYQAKYEGSAAAELPEAPIIEELSRAGDDAGASGTEEDEEEARRQVQEARDVSLFEQMVGSVEPMEGRAKYRPPRRSVPEKQSAPELPPQNRMLVTPALPTDGEGLHFVPRLNGQQRSLKKRHDRYAVGKTVPELNVRGDSLEDALRQLELFVHQSWKSGAIFLRVIHGRGLRSDGGEPILKPAIIQWLEGPGERYLRGYIPERNSAGDYGSLLLEVRSREEQ